MLKGCKESQCDVGERTDQTDIEVCPDTTGEWCNRDAVETLELVCDSWRKSGQSKHTRCSGRRHEHETLFMQRVISNNVPIKPRETKPRLRIVTHEYADAKCVPEHYASTLRTLALKSVTRRNDVEVSYT